MQPCYIYNISIFLDFGKLFYLLYYCPPRGAIKAPLDLTDRSLSQRLSPSQRAKPRSLRLLRNFKVTCTFDFVFNRSQDSEFCAAVSDLTYNSCFPPFHLCKCVRLNTRFTETGLVVITVAFTQMKRREPKPCRNNKVFLTDTYIISRYELCATQKANFVIAPLRGAIKYTSSKGREFNPPSVLRLRTLN